MAAQERALQKRPLSMQAECDSNRPAALLRSWTHSDRNRIMRGGGAHVLHNLAEHAFPTVHDPEPRITKECVPQSRISDILSGRRAISKDLAKKLAQRFNVAADLFI